MPRSVCFFKSIWLVFLGEDLVDHAVLEGFLGGEPVVAVAVFLHMLEGLSDVLGDDFGVNFTPDYRGFCNDDLIVHMNGKFHVSVSYGWKEFDTFDEALEHCKNESYWCRH